MRSGSLSQSIADVYFQRVLSQWLRWKLSEVIPVTLEKRSRLSLIAIKEVVTTNRGVRLLAWSSQQWRNALKHQAQTEALCILKHSPASDQTTIISSCFIFQCWITSSRHLASVQNRQSFLMWSLLTTDGKSSLFFCLFCSANSFHFSLTVFWGVSLLARYNAYSMKGRSGAHIQYRRTSPHGRKKNRWSAWQASVQTCRSSSAQ